MPLPDNIAQSNPQVIADHPVHADLFIRAGVIRKHNAYRLPSLLPLHQHCVPTEKLQLIHFCLRHKPLT